MERLEYIKKKKINFFHNHMDDEMRKEQERVESK